MIINKKIFLKTSSILTTSLFLLPLNAGISYATDITSDITDTVIMTSGNPSVTIRNNSTLTAFYNAISSTTGSSLTSINIESGSAIISNSMAPTYSLIDIDGSIFSGKISNSGTIIQNKNYNIFNISGSSINGGIYNNGTMQDSGEGSIIYGTAGTSIHDITNDGTMVSNTGAGEGNIIYIDNSNVTNGIINNGDMSVDSGEGAVIYALNGSTISNIRNTGTMSNNQTVSGKGTAIYIDSSTITGSITNSGTISNNAYLTNEDSTIYINNSAVTGGIILEAGGIIENASSNSSAKAIYMNNLTAATPININGGRIIGDVIDNNYSGGNDYSPITIGGAFTQEGNFIASSFTVSTNGDFTFDENKSIYSYNGITNNGLMTVRSNETVSITGALHNNGSISISSGASLISSEYIDGSGTFNIAVKDDGDNILNNNDFANIVMSVGEGATPTDLSGFTLNFEVTGTLATGNDMAVVIDTNGMGVLSGIPDVTDNSSHYKFTVSYLGNNLVVSVEESAGIEVPAGNSNNQKAANVLQELIDADAGNGDTKLQSVLDAAINTNNSTQLDNVIKKTLRPVDGSIIKGGLVVADKSANMAISRLTSVKSGDLDVASANNFNLDNNETGIAAGNPYFFTPEKGNKHVWAQTFGQIAKQSERQGFEGYDAKTYGFMVGIDSKDIIEDTTIGVSFTYGFTDVDSDSANNTQVKTDTYQVSVYGEKQLENDYRVDAIVGYAFSNSDMDIYDIGGVSGVDASANFDGHQFSAQATLSKDIKTEKGFTLTPSISTNYIYSDTDQYTDTGAGGASATVDNDAMQLFEVGVGIEASAVYKISPCRCGTDWIKPIVRAGVRHDFIGDTMESTTQFVGGGSSFKTYGLTPAQTTYNIGAGFKRYSLEDWEVTAAYDLEFKEDYYSHNASIRLGKRF